MKGYEEDHDAAPEGDLHPGHPWEPLKGERGGFLLPLHFQCGPCRGTGRRWRFWPWRRPWNTCPRCKGEGLDPVPAAEQLAKAIGGMQTRARLEGCGRIMKSRPPTEEERDKFGAELTQIVEHIEFDHFDLTIDHEFKHRFPAPAKDGER